LVFNLPDLWSYLFFVSIFTITIRAFPFCSGCSEENSLIGRNRNRATSGDSNPATHGVAGYVATKGELLNIKDAYSHPLFYSKVDEDTGFRTRNILCFPIQDEHGTIVGVAQLCNKIKAAHFSTFDEDLARAFSVYCCIAIIHSLMYKRVQAAQARHQLATELMTYHMHVPERAVYDLANAAFVSVPRDIVEADSCSAVVQMFDDLKLTKTWRIRRTTLARFVLLARKGYRDPPYHNWSHAFSVAHFTYLCLKNLRLDKCLTPLEYFSFLVASLCHDIDHRGTNNSFENSSGSALSGLYSSEGSVLERHHFSQTVCILNREGCNVFENLSEKEYSAVLDIIRDIILATDLAHHLKIKSEIDAVAESGPDWSKQQHRYLMLCLLMTASDLSDQTKVWKNTRQVAKLIYQEFFSLGDKEKSLGKQPAEGMDRDKADIPQLQVNFLNIIAAPVYKAMVKVWPAQCSVLTSQIDRNVSNWRIIGQKLSSGEVQRCDATIFESRLVPDDE
uniref:Phosphodiesterase n=1 Tax=Macrostomum lignano TaxID=282301 RepID=A0A1I8IRH7_9PLAT